VAAGAAFVDAYAVLGVPSDASDEALKRAHRALVRTHHPDLAPPERREAATRRVQEINVAYGLVRDPAARARYDRVRTLHLARERAAAPVREGTRAVRHADRSAAAAYARLLRSAGAWGGRWWRRHRVSMLQGARRVRRAGTDLVGRVLWLGTCVLWLVLGVVLASAAQRLAGTGGYLVPILGAVVGVIVGNRRGWRRRLRLAGLPPDAAHRLRGWPEIAVAAAVLAAGTGVESLFR
jgi:hypothetical protein